MKDEPRFECDENCRYLKWVFRLLVFAQFVTICLIVFGLRSAFSSGFAGVVSSLGIVFGVWSIVAMGRSMNISPELKDSAQLKTSGPYQIVRHPMYLSLLLFCIGYVWADGSWSGIAYWLALFAVLCIKVYYEERMLRERFLEYDGYAQRTRRLIPFVF